MTGFEGEIQQKLKTLEERQIEKSAQIAELNEQLDSLESFSLSTVYKEINTLFPSIANISIAREASRSDFDTIQSTSIAIVKWNSNLSRISRTSEKEKLRDYLKLRMKLEKLEIVDRK